MSYDFDISFITINYNGFKDTCELIASIQRNVKALKFQIVVSDNASDNDEASKIQERYPDVTVIANKTNLGFAGGNNIALPYARGRYLMFINNDTLVEEDHNLNKLVSRLESNPKIGMVCPKIRFAWGNRPIQYAGFTELSAITLRNRGIGYGEADAGQYDTPSATPYAHGAAMMIRREVLEKAKPMWEGYFLYYEEMDWSLAIRHAGYEIWYEPASVIYHKESKSVGEGSPLKIYYLTRNRLLFASRHRSGVSKYLCFAYLTITGLSAHATKYLLSGKPDKARSVVKGLIDFYF